VGNQTQLVTRTDQRPIDKGFSVYGGLFVVTDGNPVTVDRYCSVCEPRWTKALVLVEDKKAPIVCRYVGDPSIFEVIYDPLGQFLDGSLIFMPHWVLLYPLGDGLDFE